MVRRSTSADVCSGPPSSSPEGQAGRFVFFQLPVTQVTLVTIFFQPSSYRKVTYQCHFCHRNENCHLPGKRSDIADIPIFPRKAPWWVRWAFSRFLDQVEGCQVTLVTVDPTYFLCFICRKRVYNERHFCHWNNDTEKGGRKSGTQSSSTSGRYFKRANFNVARIKSHDLGRSVRC